MALDEDSSETIEFDEFCNGFYLLSSKSSKQEKVKFTFRIYDVNGDGSIDQEELYLLLRDVIRSESTSSVHFEDGHLREWVAATYKEICNGSDVIRLPEFRKMVDQHPVVLQALTVPLNFLHEFDESKFQKKVKETVTRTQSRRFSLINNNGKPPMAK